MTASLFNNVGIPALAISFTLSHADDRKILVSKAILLMPFVMNQELLNYLAHKSVTARSLEKIIIEKPNYFSNFNDRYYDSLSTSINAIQLLIDIDVAGLSEGRIFLKRDIEYHNDMGKRAGKIYHAARNLATLLQDSPEKLYLNLRIEV